MTCVLHDASETVSRQRPTTTARLRSWRPAGALGALDRADAARPRLLVIDREASCRDGLAKLLRFEGFAVACVTDGAAALDEAARFVPDIVLTDVEMPDLDGIDLCARLRERAPELAVILMSVNDDAPSILRGLRAGVDDFLVKPLDVTSLLASLRHALDERSQRRATLSRCEEMLSVVSHDLRNPLAVIHSCAQALRDAESMNGTDARAAAKMILRAVARSNSLVSNLLDEARLRGGGIVVERREHALEDLLGDLGELRPLALHRRLELTIESPDAKRSVTCDREKMAQALTNVVGNALKFSPAGTKVCVRAEERRGEIRFAISDRGPGIPSDARSHVFERFWHSPGSGRSGVGLGLHIAKGIVEAHGGRIWFETSSDRGTTFYVSLPIEDRDHSGVHVRDVMQAL